MEGQTVILRDKEPLVPVGYGTRGSSAVWKATTTNRPFVLWYQHVDRVSSQSQELGAAPVSYSAAAWTF